MSSLSESHHKLSVGEKDVMLQPFMVPPKVSDGNFHEINLNDNQRGVDFGTWAGTRVRLLS